MPQALSWQEAADRLGFHRVTLYRLVREDPSFARIVYTVRKTRRIDSSDLEAWIAAQKGRRAVT